MSTHQQGDTKEVTGQVLIVDDDFTIRKVHRGQRKFLSVNFRRRLHWAEVLSLSG
jgi:hypothetical protein